MDYLLLFFNFFDVLVVLLLFYLNKKYWNTKTNTLLSIIIGLILFVIVIPIISFIIEFELESDTIDNETFDAFTELHTLFKFPFYWMLFFIQFVFIPLIKIDYNNFKNKKSL